jgi:CRP-like cAMP-binding protein
MAFGLIGRDKRRDIPDTRTLNKPQTNIYTEPVNEDYETKPLFRIYSKVSTKTRWNQFFRAKPPKKYRHGTVIVEQGETNPNIFFIISGLIEYVNTDRDGDTCLMEILGANNMLNLQPVFGGNPSIGAFATLTDCLISSAGKDEIWTHMNRDSRLMGELLEEMAIIIGGLNRQLCISKENLSSRALQILYMIADCVHREHPDSDEVYVKLTQEELARVIRTTRVTVSKILGDLKRSNILDTDYRGILIKDMDALFALSRSKKR